MSKLYNTDRTIEAVIDAAERLFRERGYDKTSMQDIANGAKISKGAIYHHFKSKMEILDAVQDRQIQRMKPMIETLFGENESLSAKEKIIVMIEKTMIEPELHSLDSILNNCTKSADFVVSYMKQCIDIAAPIFAKIICSGRCSRWSKRVRLMIELRGCYLYLGEILS